MTLSLACLCFLYICLHKASNSPIGRLLFLVGRPVCCEAGEVLKVPQFTGETPAGGKKELSLAVSQSLGLDEQVLQSPSHHHAHLNTAAMPFHFMCMCSTNHGEGFRTSCPCRDPAAAAAVLKSGASSGGVPGPAAGARPLCRYGGLTPHVVMLNVSQIAD